MATDIGLMAAVHLHKNELLNTNIFVDDILFPSPEFMGHFIVALRNEGYRQIYNQLGKVIYGVECYCANGLACVIGEREKAIRGDNIYFDDRLLYPNKFFLSTEFVTLVAYLNDSLKLNFSQIADVMEFIRDRQLQTNDH